MHKVRSYILPLSGETTMYISIDGPLSSDGVRICREWIAQVSRTLKPDPTQVTGSVK